MADVISPTGTGRSASRRVVLGGAEVDLRSRSEALDEIIRASTSPGAVPLGVVSANLDHLHHFGRRGPWAQALRGPQRVRWLTLLDGHPLVTRVRRLGAGDWPRLAGSDLIEELLERAESDGIAVGFLGGTTTAHESLSERIVQRWPRLRVVGCWAPERAEVVEPERARALARTVAQAQPGLLFVGLGKPRQELWIAEHGALTGAGALLAFGAAADFVSGAARRAPEWVARSGLEWLWRLGQEPKRLARRYLVQGPPAYADLQRDSRLLPSVDEDHARGADAEPVTAAEDAGEGLEVTAIVVTHNSAAHVGTLLSDLAAQRGPDRVRTIVVDNGSGDETCELVRRAGVELVEAGANLGYAGGINVGLRARGSCDAVLVLNPDLRLAEDALDSMCRTLRRRGAGIVVPRMLEPGGQLYPSLRFEPTLLGGLLDAMLGSRWPTRGPGLADIDRDPGSYQFAHPVAWATGAALLVDDSLARRVGEWDERFFLYCEETDFFRRAREAGATVWFDPGARVHHDAHGSGSSPDLDALMAVNRVRYAERHHSKPYAAAMRGVAVLTELVRVPRGGTHPRALRALLHRGSWSRLPHATARDDSVEGSVR